MDYFADMWHGYESVFGLRMSNFHSTRKRLPEKDLLPEPGCRTIGT